MSALWAAADVARAVSAKTNDEWCAWRVEIDSRKVQAGDLFIALKGENFDGHDFVEKAFAAGAIAAIVEKKLDCGGNQLVVPDALKALENLAKYNRLRIHNLGKAKIIGITGSVGKTSTKEMLRLALSAHGKVHATSGNYNNHIGTPLNLANMPLDADFGVFEMGMNHAGEISHLTHLVCPHIAIITRVEAAHLEFFAGIEEIAAAKAEIFEGLLPDGMAVINADQPYFGSLTYPCHPREGGDLKTQAPSLHLAIDPRLRGDDNGGGGNEKDGLKYNTITFGENETADCRLLSYTATTNGCAIAAEIFGHKMAYKLAATGRHWAVISLSVLAVCQALRLDLQKSAAALASFREVEGRGRVYPIAVAGGTALIIDDSYNASPASMRAAFAKTAEIWAANNAQLVTKTCIIGRKIAILGKMLELGATAPAIHADLAHDLVAHGFDVIYSTGDLMLHLQNALPQNMRGTHKNNVEDLLPEIKIHANDVVLIKGSHGSKIYTLAQELLKRKENAI